MEELLSATKKAEQMLIDSVFIDGDTRNTRVVLLPPKGQKTSLLTADQSLASPSSPMSEDVVTVGTSRVSSSPSELATLFEKGVVLLANITLPLSFVELLLQVLLNSCGLQSPANLACASSTTPTNLLIFTNQPFGPPAPEGRRA